MGNTTNQSASVNKKTFWQEHLSSWRESGLTQQAYCRKHGLTPNTFWYWKRKLSPTDTSSPAHTATPTQTGQSQFIPVQLAPHAVTADSGLTLTLPGGCQLSGITENNLGVAKQLSQWFA